MFAALYTDEDISALLATLLKARGLDVIVIPINFPMLICFGSQK